MAWNYSVEQIETLAEFGCDIQHRAMAGPVRLKTNEWNESEPVLDSAGNPKFGAPVFIAEIIDKTTNTVYIRAEGADHALATAAAIALLPVTKKPLTRTQVLAESGAQARDEIIAAKDAEIASLRAQLGKSPEPELAGIGAVAGDDGGLGIPPPEQPRGRKGRAA